MDFQRMYDSARKSVRYVAGYITQFFSPDDLSPELRLEEERIRKGVIEEVKEKRGSEVAKRLEAELNLMNHFPGQIGEAMTYEFTTLVAFRDIQERLDRIADLRQPVKTGR